MEATQKLPEIGQSLWLDNITRGLKSSGTLRRYIQDLSVTGRTSNPTIFNLSLGQIYLYDYPSMANDPITITKGEHHADPI